MTPPLIAVTMGDPAGVGPEIIARDLRPKEISGNTIGSSSWATQGFWSGPRACWTWRCAQTSSQNQRMRGSSLAP